MAKKELLIVVDIQTQNAQKNLKKVKENVDNLGKGIDENISKRKNSIDELGDVFGALVVPLKSAKEGVNSFGSALKLVTRNPFFVILGTLVSTLTAIYKSFVRTEEGANKVNQVLSFLKGLIIPIRDGFASLGDLIVSVFTEPKKAIQDFANSLQEWVIEKVNLFMEGIGLLGESISELFSGNFKKSLEAASKGLDSLDRAVNPLRMAVDTVTESVTKYVEEAGKMANANTALEKQQQRLIKLERENAVALSRQLREREELMNIRDNELLSIDERIDANEKLNKIETEQLERSKQIAQLAINIAQERINIDGATTENLNALKDAQVEYNNVLADSLGRQNEYILNNQTLQREGAEFARAEIEFELEKINIIEDSEGKKLKAKIHALEKTRELYGKETIEFKEFTKQKELAELEYQKFINDRRKKDEEDERISNEKKAQSKIDAEKKVCEMQGGVWIEGKGCDFTARDEAQKQTLREMAVSAAVDQAKAVGDAVFQVQQQQLQRETQQQLEALTERQRTREAVLNSRLERGIITEEQYEKERQELARKSEQEKLSIEKKAFEKKQKQDIAQAISNGALALTNILATVPKFDLGVAQAILSAQAVATTATQVALIKRQKFAKGGILDGASHSQGGIKTPYGELEGGEAVINKKSTAMFKPILSALNQAGGGIKFESGGVLGSSNSANVEDSGDLVSILGRLENTLQKPVKSYVVETEITSSQNTVNSIEDRATI